MNSNTSKNLEKYFQYSDSSIIYFSQSGQNFTVLKQASSHEYTSNANRKEFNFLYALGKVLSRFKVVLFNLHLYKSRNVIPHTYQLARTLLSLVLSYTSLYLKNYRQ